MGDIRAFIAIGINSELKAELADLIKTLSTYHTKTVKWVDPEGIHLTIKFLGNVSEEKIVDIKRALSKVSSSSYPFNLHLGKTGAFPNINSPRVVWVGIEGDIPYLISLQRKIENSMLPIGFPAEKKSFSAHLTLGRVRDQASKQERYALGRDTIVASISHKANLYVDTFCLMKSTLTPRGAIYEQLDRFSLDKI